MPNQTKLTCVSTRNSSNAASRSGLAHSANANQPTEPSEPDVDNASLSADIAKIYALLKETSGKQEEKLSIIERTTTAVESKIAELTTRINDVEGRLDFLEDANKSLVNNPPATKTEVEQLRRKIDDLENRSRRNNLRFVGFPEGSEGRDILHFLRQTIPQLLHLDFPGGVEIDRAHRTAARRRSDGGLLPRPIIARFLRFQDRERIATAARKAGRVTWNSHHIMVFPDYSRLVVEMRSKFNQCKQLLHDRGVKFSLMYPAVLVIKTTDGRREFDDPKKAANYIQSLPTTAGPP